MESRIIIDEARAYKFRDSWNEKCDRARVLWYARVEETLLFIESENNTMMEGGETNG